jgi:hypothetical protein
MSISRIGTAGRIGLNIVPLGQGKVDLPAVLALFELSPEMKIIMVELDPSPDPPYPPWETARISKEYLVKQGYAFRPEKKS